MRGTAFTDIADKIPAPADRPAVAERIMGQIFAAWPYGRVEELFERLKTDPDGIARSPAFRRLVRLYLEGKGPDVVCAGDVKAILGPPPAKPRTPPETQHER